MNSRPQSAEGACLATASALDLNLRALRPLLTRSEVTELCINQPGVAFLETREGWQRESIPFADFDWCRRLAKLVANSTRQRVDEESPLLSASLPSGERIQIVSPPAASFGRRAAQATPLMTLRCSSRSCCKTRTTRPSCAWRSSPVRTSWS